jgi:MFS family permease
MGPALGGWLTYDYSWRWIFYINLPVGVLCTLGILIFIRQTRNVHREPFDFVGFLTLSLGIGALQLPGSGSTCSPCTRGGILQRVIRDSAERRALPSYWRPL